MNDQVVKLILIIREKFGIDSNLESVEIVRQIISETEDEIETLEENMDDVEEETEKLTLLKQLLNLYLKSNVTIDESSDPLHSLSLDQLKEKEKKNREEIISLLGKLEMPHNITKEALTKEKEKTEKYLNTLKKKTKVEKQKLEEIQNKVEMIELGLEKFDSLKKIQIIRKKKTIDGIKNKKLRDLVLELDEEYNSVDCIDLGIFDEKSLLEKINQIYEEIIKSEKRDSKKIKQLIYLENFSEKIKKLRELEMHEREKGDVLNYFQSLNSNNEFIENIQNFSLLFEKLERNFDNFTKKIEGIYQIPLNILEEKVQTVRKLEYNDISEYFSNIQEYTLGIKNLDLFLKLFKFFYKDENLKNLEEEHEAYPSNSIEKIILKLLYDLKLSFKTDVSKIDKIVEEIQHRLKEESLESYDTKGLMTNIQANIYFGKFLDAAGNLHYLLKLINPINVFEIERLFNKTAEKAKLIQGKNIILLLGCTGTGKSTTICYLAFCKMRKDINKHIDIDPESKTKINCKINWRTKSETRYINPILINLLGKKPNFKEREIIICDTPGFLNTEDVEIDISNGLGAIHAIKGCKGVKPVLVFSKSKVGEKFELLENTFLMIIEIIDKGFEYHLPSLDYLFTGFEKSELPMIKKKLSHLKKNKEDLKNKEDQLFTKILGDILEKLTEDKIINPLDGHPEKLLQIWIKDSKYIENCDETFKFVINADSKNTVIHFCNAIKKSVMINAQKFKNFEIVDFKLTQLKTLKNIVQIKEIDEFYDNIIKEVSDYLNAFYENECDKFNKGFEIGNNFSVKDIISYKEMINLVKLTDNLKLNHLGEKVYSIKYFEKNMLSNIETLLTIIGLDTTPEKEILSSLRKIYHLSIEFKEFDAVYSKTLEIKTEIEKKIECAFESFKKNLEELKNDQSVNKIKKYLLNCLTSLDYVKSISENLDKFIPGVSEKNGEFKKILQEFLQAINDKINYEEKDLIEAKEFIEQRFKNIKLMEAVCSLPFDKYIDSSQLKEYNQEMLNQLEEDCNKIVKIIQEELESDSQDIFSVKNNYDILNEYRKKFYESKYKQYIEPSIKEASEFLKSSFNKIVDDVNKIINNIQGQDEKAKINSFSLSKLGKGLNLLNNKEHQEWLKSFIGGCVRHDVSIISDRVREYLYEMRDQFVQMELDVFNHKNIPNAIELMENVMQAREFGCLGEDFKQIFEDIRNYFETSVDTVLNYFKYKSNSYKILDEIDLTNEVLNYLSYFNDVYKIKVALKRFSLKKDYVGEASKKIKSIQSYIKERLCDMDNDLECLFKKIKNIELKNQNEAENECMKIIDSLKKFKKINSLNKISHLLHRNLKEVIRDYNNFFNEFSENSELFTNNPEKFQIILNVYKRLSKIDSEFIEFGQAKSFDELYRSKIIEQKLSEAEEKLQKNKFEEFATLVKSTTIEKFPELKKNFITIAENAQKKIIQSFESALSRKNVDDLVIESKKISLFIEEINKINFEPLKNDTNDHVKEIYNKKIGKIISNFPKMFESDSSNIDSDSILKDFIYINEIMKKNKNFGIFNSFLNDYELAFQKILKIIDSENNCLIEYIENRLIRNSERLKKIIEKRKFIENVVSEILKPEILNLISEKFPNLNIPEGMPQKIIISQSDLIIFLQKYMEEIIEKNFSQLNLSEIERKEFQIRKEEYEEISNTLKFLKNFENFKEFNDEFGKGYTQSQAIINEKINDHFKRIEKNYLNRKPDDVYSEKECIDINIKLENFNLISQKFPFVKDKCLENHQNITKNLSNQLENLKELALKSDDTTLFTKALLKAQVYKSYLPEIIQSDKAKDIQIEILVEYKKKAEKKGQNGFEALNILGNQILMDPIGQIFISEHKFFKSIKISLFNEKIKKIPVETILNGNADLRGIEGDDMDKVQILKRYDEFDREYKDLIKTYLKPKAQGGIHIDHIKQNLQLILEGLIKEKNKKGFFEGLKKWFDYSPKFEIPKILACVFAIWTLKNAEDFFELSNKLTDDTAREKYLLQPHPVQVLSILRMFSCGDKDERIKNGLVQIGTGEGKSVTLAITATVLVLFGYSVECVCYSTDLSSRDFEDFREFFRYIGVLDYIEYGPFSFLCEKFINSDINLRESTLEFYGVKTEKKKNMEKIEEIREKILLFDEVDVFFSKDFYGATYNPTAFFKHPCIFNLFKMVWNQRKGITYSNVLKSNEFQNCLKEFPKMNAILREAIKDILAACKSEIENNYEVINDRIAYKEQDSISFDISYGYTTTFTYFLERDRGYITQQSLEDNCGVQIKLGSFS